MVYFKNDSEVSYFLAYSKIEIITTERNLDISDAYYDGLVFLVESPELYML